MNMVTSPCIAHFFVTALQQRCSIVTHPETGETVVIDGGGDSDRIISWLDEGIGNPDAMIGDFVGQRKVVALINTHAHFGVFLIMCMASVSSHVQRYHCVEYTVQDAPSPAVIAAHRCNIAAARSAGSLHKSEPAHDVARDCRGKARSHTHTL